MINVTQKIKDDLAKAAKQYGIYEEALAGYLLRDGLSDEERLKKAANFIKATGMRGATAQAAKLALTSTKFL